MKIISGTTDFMLPTETAVAIGKFDGVHLGHRKLISEITAQKEKGLKACVFTFDRSPAELFSRMPVKVITTLEEKRKIFEELGVDVLVEFPLNEQTAATDPTFFAKDILKRRLKAKMIVAGNDLSFGAGGKGDAALLRSLQDELDFCVKTIDKVCVDGTEVSSTAIRELLEKGETEKASEFLGDYYSYTGTVVHGNRIGHKLGFPTVNILPKANKILCPFGVYFTKVKRQGKTYYAVSNIGCKPTITEEKIVGVETYLYDFNEEIYGEDITVSFYKYRRPEMVFSGLEALQEQLKDDMASGELFWK